MWVGSLGFVNELPVQAKHANCGFGVGVFERDIGIVAGRIWRNAQVIERCISAVGDEGNDAIGCLFVFANEGTFGGSVGANVAYLGLISGVREQPCVDDFGVYLAYIAEVCPSGTAQNSVPNLISSGTWPVPSEGNFGWVATCPSQDICWFRNNSGGCDDAG